MGEFLNHMARWAGESARIRKTAKQEKQMTPDKQKLINDVTQRAQNGDVEAMFALGSAYFNAEYVRYDPDEACYWWTEAAKRGHIVCQLNLGYLYHGGVSAYFYDENLAGYWFNVAANNGSQEAYDMLKEYYKYSNFSKKWKRIK